MLVDSNILIYASKPPGQKARDFIRQHTPLVSSISQIEVLGYHRLSTNEIQLLNAFFTQATVLPLSVPVVREAILLRQQRKLSLGDAIVAATALIHHLTLATHNTSDFAWITGLKLIDPMI